MSQSTRTIPNAYGASGETDRLISRLADDADLELEDIYSRANRRLKEVFGYALAQSVPVELWLEQPGESVG